MMLPVVPTIRPVSYTHLDVYKRQVLAVGVGAHETHTPDLTFDGAEAAADLKIEGMQQMLPDRCILYSFRHPQGN